MNSKNRWQQMLRSGLAVLGLVALTSCGGGKREAFHPGHVYVFGDEFSSISDVSPADLSRYTVNVVATTSPSTIYNPEVYPSWTQYVASLYGKDPLSCSATLASSMSMCANPGDTSSDTITAMSSKNFQKDELVVILTGTRDILNAYNDFKTGCGGNGCSISSLATTLTNKGIALGQKINSVVGTGARVAVVTVPDIGLSPYALGETGGTLRNINDAMDCPPDGSYAPHSNVGSDRSVALSYLTACFNYGLRGTHGIVNNGKKIALIGAFDRTVLAVRNPSGYGLTDPFNPACPTTVVPHSTAAIYTPTLCYYDAVTTPSTPVYTSVPSPGTYLWSMGPWLGPGGHSILGSYAASQLNLNWGE